MDIWEEQLAAKLAEQMPFTASSDLFIFFEEFSTEVPEADRLLDDAETMSNLMQFKGEHAKKIIAKCPYISEEGLRHFATSTDERVRMSVAENTKCPADILHILLTDRRWAIRSAARKNPNSPIDEVVDTTEEESFENDNNYVLPYEHLIHPQLHLDGLTEY